MAEGQCTVEFRDIPGFPGYRIGDDGSVWRLWVTCRSGRKLSDRWRLMRPSTTTRGYRYLNLVPPEGGRFQTFRVHRLVLESFVGPCPDGMECRHLNGNKADNRLTNLMWGTPEENRDDNRSLGTYGRGETHTQAKLTESQVRAIRERYAAGGVLQRELAAEFGVGEITVWGIVNRRTWTHVT